MKVEHQKAIDELRELGFAVAIWTPEETQGVDISDLEDRVISVGNDFISDCGGGTSDEDDEDDEDESNPSAPSTRPSGQAG